MTDYEIAYIAFRNISFRPEERARYYADGIAEAREAIRATAAKLGEENGIAPEIASQIGDEECTRIHRLWRAWMGAKSRCISSMITGSSNFPVRRAEKANRSEEKHARAFMDAQEYATKRMKKRMGIVEPLACTRIGESGAVAALEAEIKQAEERQELMVAANKAIRKHKTSADRAKALSDIGIDSGSVAAILKPNCFGGIGFERFELSNNSANIRRLKAQLSAAKMLAATSATFGWEHDECSAEIDDARVLLRFPGKPDSETIAKLKGAAFKWSPSRHSWSRLDTPNARSAAERFRPAATMPA